MHINGLPLFILISSGLLNAAVVPGRWEKVESLLPGTQIAITLKTGDHIYGTFKSVDGTTLRVTRDLRGRSSITTTLTTVRLVSSYWKSDVAEVTVPSEISPENDKPIWTGTGVGAAAGAGTAAILLCNPTPCDESDAGIIFGMGLAGALIGFAVGTVVADVPPDEVIYQAPGYNTWVLLADKWKRP